MPTREYVQAHYDQHMREALVAFARGHKRIEGSIALALHWIPAEAHCLMDMGCAIGWAAWEFKRRRPAAAVYGVDIGRENIDMATRLFGHDGLQFRIQDLTQQPWRPPQPCDAVSILDVYEHIPIPSRGDLHRFLNQCLSPDALVVMAVPSVRHLEYLRRHMPERVQPVDEDVTSADLARLASDLGGKVIFESHVSIFHENDYVHAVVGRGAYSAAAPTRGGGDAGISSLPERRAQLKARLNRTMSEDGFLLRRQGEPGVCMTYVSPTAGGEPCVRDYIECLPASAVPLRCGRDADYRDQGRSLIVWPNVVGKAREAIRRVRGLPPAFSLSGPVRRFLRRNAVRAIVAQPGAIALDIADMIHDSGIPMVVLFQDQDLYNAVFFKDNEARFVRLWDTAAALVVPSAHMQQQAIALGAPASKLHVNPLGVAPEMSFRAQPQQAPPLFVCDCVFSERHAPHLLLLAFDTVRKAVPEARLVIVGDGVLLSPCRQLARALGLSEFVELPGRENFTKLSRRLRDARAYVRHNLRAGNGECEGAPISLIHAAATWLPIVATQHGAIPEVVNHGVTGLLVPEGDVNSMAQAMIDLARDGTLAQRLGEVGRRRACEEFTLQQSVGRLWNVVEQVMR